MNGILLLSVPLQKLQIHLHCILEASEHGQIVFINIMKKLKQNQTENLEENQQKGKINKYSFGFLRFSLPDQV